MAALFVILFIYGWNQYLWSLLITTDPEMNTIVAIKQCFVGDDTANWIDHGHLYPGDDSSGDCRDFDAEAFHPRTCR